MAGREKSREDSASEADTNAWMVTFSDLLTLMITFFVLLLSMSSMDDKKLKNIFGAFTDALGVLEMGSGSEIKNIALFDVGNIYQELLMEKDIIRNLLDEAITGENGLALDSLKGSIDFDSMISVDDRRGIVVTLSDAILFEPGQTDMSKDAYSIIDKLAAHLKGSDFLISVEGHTDSTPDGAGPSKWFISAKRAMNVIRYLNEVSEIEIGRLSGRGYGEFSPLADNLSSENRAKNRRIEIVLSKRW